MKILIIGSLGFIGRHCMSYFSSIHDTYGCDIHSDCKNQKHFTISPNAIDINCIFEKYNFDICINCAGSAVVSESFTDPSGDFFRNTVLLVNILNAIRNNSPHCKFINISSAAVYGNPITLPIPETAKPNPISPYGFHKLMAENLCQEYTKIYKLHTCSLRIFSAYGPELRKQLIWDILSKIKHSNQITLFGTGQETRDFIYIDDIIQAINIIIHKSDFNADIINIASGQQTSISHIINTIQSIHPSAFEFSFNNITRPGDPLHWQADISRLQSWGFTRTTSIQQGLTKVISWFLKENI